MKQPSDNETTFSVAVFPFLKTSAPVPIGSYLFRSTDDRAGLPEGQASAVAEIASMLFAKDDFRVESASYAVLPHVDQNRPGENLERLIELQAVVTYLYSQPHEVFDSLLLTPEDCMLHLFTPGEVSEFLVRPGHHTVDSNPERPKLAADDRHMLPGYNGLFNLRRAFWCAAGSRIYPAFPHVTLNISQDLASNLDVSHSDPRWDFSPARLLSQTASSAADRVFTALYWYNFANEQTAGPDRALLNLATAFEALLQLPEDAKSDRLVDAISLLLGRTTRVDSWARQFYRARSAVAHEGSARDLHFQHTDLGGKPGKLDGRAAPLMFYGRQIFQLCVTTVLTGSALARRADLQEKLITNGERLAAICTALARTEGRAAQRLAAIGRDVAALQRYRYLDSGPIPVASHIGAVRAASGTLLQANGELTGDIRSAAQACAAPAAKRSERDQLDAIRVFHDLAKGVDTGTASPELRLVLQLIDFVWMSIFMRYYQLRESKASAEGETGGEH